MQDFSDAELVRLCLLGKYQYYGVIVERYEVLVRTLAERLVGDIDESEKIAHETFVTAYDRLGEFSFGHGRFAIWLLGIAAERARDHVGTKGSGHQFARLLPLRRWRRRPASRRLKDAAEHVVPS